MEGENFHKFNPFIHESPGEPCCYWLGVKCEHCDATVNEYVKPRCPLTILRKKAGRVPNDTNKAG